MVVHCDTVFRTFLPESPIIPDICDLPVVKHLFGDGLRLAIQAEPRYIKV
jgi:hypothetical protein